MDVDKLGSDHKGFWYVLAAILGILLIVAIIKYLTK